MLASCEFDYWFEVISSLFDCNVDIVSSLFDCRIDFVLSKLITVLIFDQFAVCLNRGMKR